MWGYTVLNALDGAPARTQAALAQAIGADKTRIIATLDELQQAGLITREPDPADRRARLRSITGQDAISAVPAIAGWAGDQPAEVLEALGARRDRCGRLTRRWDWEPSDDGGVTVWAEIT
jgi:DNA-binding HxlR family transcriptional regulator